MKQSTNKARGARALLGAAAAVVWLAVVGCQQQMSDQPRYDPLEPSGLFADRRAARPAIEGTVARGQLRLDEHFYRGKVDGQLAETFPFRVNRGDLERGQEQYNVFCAPCHDRVGTGRGMVVRRGFREPPSFHAPRLRESPPGHFFDVMTNGFGAMPAYAPQIGPRDRWAIAAYVRALQLSQHARVADLRAEERRALEEQAE